jgi:hypothetical protein
MTKQVFCAIPPALRHHIREANILDTDSNAVQEKLQQRLSANILSYLQLGILKVNSPKTFAVDENLKAHSDRNDYAETIPDRLQNS